MITKKVETPKPNYDDINTKSEFMQQITFNDFRKNFDRIIREKSITILKCSEETLANKKALWYYFEGNNEFFISYDSSNILYEVSAGIVSDFFHSNYTLNSHLCYCAALSFLIGTDLENKQFINELDKINLIGPAFGKHEEYRFGPFFYRKFRHNGYIWHSFFPFRYGYLQDSAIESQAIQLPMLSLFDFEKIIDEKIRKDNFTKSYVQCLANSKTILAGDLYISYQYRSNNIIEKISISFEGKEEFNQNYFEKRYVIYQNTFDKYNEYIFLIANKLFGVLSHEWQSLLDKERRYSISPHFVYKGYLMKEKRNSGYYFYFYMNDD